MLLFYLLQTLVRENANYYQIRHGIEPEQVEVLEADFEARAHDLGITDLTPFYRSGLFQSNNFLRERNNRGTKVLRKAFVAGAT